MEPAQLNKLVCEQCEHDLIESEQVKRDTVVKTEVEHKREEARSSDWGWSGE